MSDATVLFQEEEHRSQSLDLALWRRLWGYARRYRRDLGFLCLFAVVTALVDVSFPLITRAVVDEVVARRGEARLLPYGLAFAGLTLVFAGSVASFIRLAGKIRTHVACDIRRDGFDNLQALSFGYFDRRLVVGGGDARVRLPHDARAGQDAALEDDAHERERRHDR